MAFLLKVNSLSLSKREGVTGAGKPWVIYSQDDCTLQINGELRKFPVNVADPTQLHPVGSYLLDVDPIVVVGKYGLEIDRYAPLPLSPYVPSVASASASKS